MVRVATVRPTLDKRLLTRRQNSNLELALELGVKKGSECPLSLLGSGMLLGASSLLDLKLDSLPVFAGTLSSFFIKSYPHQSFHSHFDHDWIRATTEPCARIVGPFA